MICRSFTDGAASQERLSLLHQRLPVPYKVVSDVYVLLKKKKKTRSTYFMVSTSRHSTACTKKTFTFLNKI